MPPAQKAPPYQPARNPGATLVHLRKTFPFRLLPTFDTPIAAGAEDRGDVHEQLLGGNADIASQTLWRFLAATDAIGFGPDLLPRGIEQLAGSVRYRWSLDEVEDLLKFLAANCNHASVQAPRDTDAGAAGAVGSALPLRPQQAEKSPDTFLVHDSLLREFTAVGDSIFARVRPEAEP